ADILRPGLRPVGGLLSPTHLGGGNGLAMLPELHHVAGGAAGERSVQGGDEAIGVERERDAGWLVAGGELRSAPPEPTGADNVVGVRRLHGVRSGSGPVKRESAG